jgi:hypothetical protein
MAKLHLLNLFKSFLWKYDRIKDIENIIFKGIKNTYFLYLVKGVLTMFYV